MVCSFVLAAAAAATLACLSAAANTGELLPSSSETPLSFGDGYTQLFGDSNLALHGGGKRVHISLDERTGGSARRFMLVSRPIDAQPMPSRAPCFLLSVREPHRRSALLRCVQAPGSRRRPRTSTGSSAPASSCPPTTPPASSSPSTYVSQPTNPTQPPMLRFFVL